MAPTDQKMKNKTFTAKKNSPQGVKKKRKWAPEDKIFRGSVQEGQGFAFRRKQKIQHEYNKLRRKEDKKKQRVPETPAMYKEEYPEHLKHLYMAEAEKLKKEAWTNRLNRTKHRMKGKEKEKEEECEKNDDAEQQSEAPEPAAEVDGATEPGDAEPAAAPETESLPMSNRMRKKLLKKTSYQKTKEELEQVREKRRKKKEEFLKNKQQREEAIQKYKQKKLETFQMLSKKTKKGQPNLNLQMEYLLKKIQGTDK